MLRLTLRNLFARKMRLVMSGLAIVLGVAFLSGVLVFSNGLSSTFDGIINGSTPDGVVRAEGFDEFNAGDSGTADGRRRAETWSTDLEALPEVDRADGNVDGFGMSLLASDGTLVGGTGAPTLAFNYHDAPNMAGEPILELRAAAGPTARRDRARRPARLRPATTRSATRCSCWRRTARSSGPPRWSAPPSSTAAVRRARPC